jgi:hypothetical protein
MEQPFSRAKILENLVTSVNEEEIVSLISSAHFLLDNEAISVHSFSADSAAKFLLDVDNAVLSHATKYGQHSLKQTWKRLIKFYKSYHESIPPDIASALMSVLNCRSIHYVNLLSVILNSLTKFDSCSNKDQHSKVNEFFFQLHSLVFYCQRISASLSYFKSVIDKENAQVSVEILLSLRGFIEIIQTAGEFDLEI